MNVIEEAVRKFAYELVDMISADALKDVEREMGVSISAPRAVAPRRVRPRMKKPPVAAPPVVLVAPPPPVARRAQPVHRHGDGWNVVLSAVVARPGGSTADVARATGMPAPSCRRLLNRMRAAHVIHSRSATGTVCWFPHG